MNYHTQLKYIGVLLSGLVTAVFFGGSASAANFVKGSKVLTPPLVHWLGTSNAIALESAKTAISSTYVQNRIAKTLARELGTDKQKIDADVVGVPGEGHINVTHDRSRFGIASEFNKTPVAWINIASSAIRSDAEDTIVPKSRVAFGRQLRESHYALGEEPNWIGLQHQIFGSPTAQQKLLYVVIDYDVDDLTRSNEAVVSNGLAFLADHFYRLSQNGELPPGVTIEKAFIYEDQLMLTEQFDDYGLMQLRFEPGTDQGEFPKLHKVTFMPIGQQFDVDVTAEPNRSADGS